MQLKFTPATLTYASRYTLLDVFGRHEGGIIFPEDIPTAVRQLDPYVIIQVARCFHRNS